MRHDWVLDVLGDLIAYARRNSLPGLAAGAEALRRTAEAELGRADTSSAGGDTAGEPGPDEALGDGQVP